jgi:hypothetical protein
MAEKRKHPERLIPRLPPPPGMANKEATDNGCQVQPNRRRCSNQRGRSQSRQSRILDESCSGFFEAVMEFIVEIPCEVISYLLAVFPDEF